MKTISRRTFVKGSAMATAGVCICGIGGCATLTGVGNTPAVKKDAYRVSAGKLALDLSQTPELNKVGGSIKIVDSQVKDSLIIARLDSSRFVASSILCTHRGTEVEYLHEDRLFKCASIGGSKFTMDGSVVSGPAGRPLKTYQVEILENELLITI